MGAFAKRYGEKTARMSAEDEHKRKKSAEKLKNYGKGAAVAAGTAALAYGGYKYWKHRKKKKEQQKKKKK